MRRLRFSIAAVSVALLSQAAVADTQTPIKHLIVIVGENHTFVILADLDESILATLNTDLPSRLLE